MAEIDLPRLTHAIRSVLVDELGPLGSDLPPPDRLDATLVLVPSKDGTQSKEMPIGAISHKIVMARDRLRLLEQVVNSCTNINDLERLRLHARITRVQEALVALGGVLVR